MEKLKPCPFCGQIEAVEVLSDREINCSLDEEYHDEDLSDHPWFAVCCRFGREGGCGATGGYRTTQEEAAEVWNERVEK